MKRYISIFGLLLSLTIGIFNFSPCYAVDCNKSDHYLGLRAIYDGLLIEDQDTHKCVVDKNKFYTNKKDDSQLVKSIWLIILNITSSVLGVVGYLAICFVIWGGYQYVLARGDPQKVVKGKRTITNALIGLAVCMTASILSGVISDIAAEGANGNIFIAAMNSAFFWAAIVATVVIVIGGIQYIASNGNPSNVTKAKQTILYAAIGLVIIIAAVAIVNTVVKGVLGS